jgi:hypothetical protein
VLALEESMISGSLQEMDVAWLKILALDARKVLHSNKFEKRQSAYWRIMWRAYLKILTGLMILINEINSSLALLEKREV